MQDPIHTAEKAGPDGRGLYYEEIGLGYRYLKLTGSRLVGPDGTVDVLWNGPYGGCDYRLAGWPFYALRSRVTVLDSRSGGGGEGYWETPEGIAEAAYNLAHPPRRRWDLPRDEILHRGLASQDMPQYLHAKPNRRLPLIPLFIGFAADMFFYAAFIFLLLSLLSWLRQYWQSRRRGFPVLTAHPAAHESV